MSAWTGLDFFIFLIFLVNIMLGMARGGMKEMISLLSLCAALVITIKFTVPLTEFVYSSPLKEDFLTSQFVINFTNTIGMSQMTERTLFQMSYCISLLICFVGAFSVCEAVLSYSNMMEAFGFATSVANRKMGAALGSMRGFVIVLVFIIVLQHLFGGDVPASNFIVWLDTPTQKFDHLITSQAPERYLEILQDKNLYNPENILNALREPK